MLITPPLVVEWSICDVYVSLGVSEDILMDRQTNKLTHHNTPVLCQGRVINK